MIRKSLKIVLLFIICISLGCEGKIEEAEKYLKEDQYEKSIEILKMELKDHPSNTEADKLLGIARTKLAESFISKKEYKEALGVLKIEIKEHPTNVKAKDLLNEYKYYALGDEWYKIKMVQESKESKHFIVATTLAKTYYKETGKEAGTLKQYEILPFVKKYNNKLYFIDYNDFDIKKQKGWVAGRIINKTNYSENTKVKFKPHSWRYKPNILLNLIKKSLSHRPCWDSGKNKISSFYFFQNEVFFTGEKLENCSRSRNFSNNYYGVKFKRKFYKDKIIDFDKVVIDWLKGKQKSRLDIIKKSNWSEKVKISLLKGLITTGMNPLMVSASLGEPKGKSKSHGEKGNIEKHLYESGWYGGTELTFVNGRLAGWQE